MTDIETIRLLTNDLSPDPDQLYTDVQVQAFLDLEGGVVKLAAASILDAIASNEAMVSKKIRTLDLQTDGPAVAASLTAAAAELRRQVYEDGPGEYEVSTNLGTPRRPFGPELTEHGCYGEYGYY